MKNPFKKISSVLLCLGAALYFATVLNIPLWAKLVEIEAAEKSIDPGFALTIPVFLAAFFNFALLLVSYRPIQKPLLCLLILFSAVISYASFEYGVIFDDDMFRNVAETNSGEAVSYLNASLFLWIFGLGVIPVILVLAVPLKEESMKRAFLGKLLSGVASVAVVLIIAAFYFEDYAATVRNHSVLRRIIVPNYAIGSAFKFIRKEYFYTPPAYQTIGADAELQEEEGEKAELLVVVVGETQRAQNYSLGGYARETNPYTAREDVIFFNNVHSCGTATAVSVPCMFSLLPRADYSKEKAKNQDGIINILTRADVGVHWVDNDAGCKDTCEGAAYIDLRKKYEGLCDEEGCQDGLFTGELQSIMKGLSKTGEHVIVLHMMGSHGPTYWKRYPAEFAKFKPDCPRSDIQNCSKESLINTYDNTILYEDYVLSQLIGVLKKDAKKFKSALLFVSDHGESLGEKGVYLHGLPYAIAPEEQTHIPMIFWTSEGFRDEHKIDLPCVREKARNSVLTHNNVPHSILGLSDVATQAYEAEKDIFHSCRYLPPVKTDAPKP